MVKTAAAWVHLGANIGAAGGQPRLQASSDELEGCRPRRSRAAARVQQRVPRGTIPTARPATFTSAAAGMSRCLAVSPSFHSVTDRWPAAVDASLRGSEVEVAELTLAPNSDSGEHRHAVTETFYLLEGEMEQVINGTPVKLGPGMVASIRETDQVRHKAGPNGAKILVIWAPGGEIARVTASGKRSSRRGIGIWIW